MNTAMNLVAIDDPILHPDAEQDALNKNACGRIVWWALSGETAVDALSAALADHKATVAPPAAPSPMVALHRAADDAAKSNSAECRKLARGSWAIAGKAEEQLDDAGADVLVSAIRSRVWLSDDETVQVRGLFEEEIRTGYDRARRYLSQAAISQWLCKTIDGLGAVPLRESGGVYFLPRDVVSDWEPLVSAISAVKLFSVPALRSADALDAILAAVTKDTEKACAELSADLGSAGKRALETRENDLQALVERTGRYEAILGKKLDDLRAAIGETRGAITAAMFAIVQDDAE